MKKRYIVSLTGGKRETLRGVVKKLSGASQKVVRRAQMLLKADVNGANWSNARTAEAFDYRRQTVEQLRKRLIAE